MDLICRRHITLRDRCSDRDAGLGAVLANDQQPQRRSEHDGPAFGEFLDEIAEQQFIGRRMRSRDHRRIINAHRQVGVIKGVLSTDKPDRSASASKPAAVTNARPSA